MKGRRSRGLEERVIMGVDHDHVVEPGHRMMPGQEPYTPAEYEALQRLMTDAMDEQDEFGVDELERRSR